jgi:hypothetical protein
MGTTVDFVVLNFSGFDKKQEWRGLLNRTNVLTLFALAVGPLGDGKIRQKQKKSTERYLEKAPSQRFGHL